MAIQTTGCHRRDGGRPVGKRRKTRMMAGPPATSSQVCAHAASVPNGSDPGAMTSARLAYWLVTSERANRKPIHTNAQPTTLAGCREVIRAPTVAIASTETVRTE
jgi:hypothetical protein